MTQLLLTEGEMLNEIVRYLEETAGFKLIAKNKSFIDVIVKHRGKTFGIEIKRMESGHPENPGDFLLKGVGQLLMSKEIYGLDKCIIVLDKELQFKTAKKYMKLFKKYAIKLIYYNEFIRRINNGTI